MHAWLRELLVAGRLLLWEAGGRRLHIRQIPIATSILSYFSFRILFLTLVFTIFVALTSFAFVCIYYVPVCHRIVSLCHALFGWCGYSK